MFTRKDQEDLSEVMTAGTKVDIDKENQTLEQRREQGREKLHKMALFLHIPVGLQTVLINDRFI